MREAAILDGLCGFLIEVSRLFRVVGIDGDNDAALGHESGIVWNGIVGLDLVCPPIGERGGTDACSSKFVGDFVAFENVLKGADLEAELFGDTKKHEDFVFAITMRVNVAFAFEDFDQRVEAKVAAKRQKIFLTCRDFFVVRVPSVFIVASLGESRADGFFDAHSRCGITLFAAGNGEIRTLGILAECELDSGKSAFEGEFCGRLAPA